MQVIKARNVNDALVKGLDHLELEGEFRGSRAGKVLESVSPVTTVYSNPNERVLFSEDRDANPFFHFIEGLWMLNGERDVETVAFYVKRMGSFSDDGKTLNGAYGWRWRKHFDFDQIFQIIERLKKDPDDRRCVLTMWEPNDLLNTESRDVPCNTQIYFKIRQARLHMTVCCRSNDIIWGAYGANAVHMSMLHEVMASAIGVSLGEYSQISDSFHAYKNVFTKLRKKIHPLDYYSYTYPLKGYNNEYQLNAINPYPIISVDYTKWFGELDMFMSELKRYKHKAYKLESWSGYTENFFKEVAVPIAKSYALYKDGVIDLALQETKKIKASDWKMACSMWLKRRQITKESYKDIEAVL